MEEIFYMICFLLVIFSVEAGSAILSVLGGENGSARFEDYPDGAVSNDAIEDEVS